MLFNCNVFLATLAAPVFAATQYINDVNSSPSNYFGFGNGAYVGFASDCYCDVPIQQVGGYCIFTNLVLDGATSTLDLTSTVNVVVSHSDSEVRWLNYTVLGQEHKHSVVQQRGPLAISLTTPISTPPPTPTPPPFGGVLPTRTPYTFTRCNAFTYAI